MALATPALNRADEPALDAAERMSVDELRALQLERLRTTLRRAHDSVPHYREGFARAGVSPDEIRDLSDLRRLRPGAGGAGLLRDRAHLPELPRPR